MLANEGPLNFISGGEVQLEPVLREGNKKEFHHIFPRSFLSERNIPNNRINAIINFAVLSRADNNKLGGTAPSIYRAKMRGNNEAIRLIMKRSLCPEDIFHDDYEKFVRDRAEILVAKAKQLMGLQ